MSGSPEVELSQSQSDSEENYEEIVLGAFQGEIEEVKVPFTYRFGILLVALVMVLLPLIYIGMIGLVGYVVYYHAVNHTGILHENGNATVRFLIYVAPIVIGCILVLFMFKPIFSRPAKPSKQINLDKESEPLLFAFVAKICEAVHAPIPKRIEVNNEVNASASFRRGFWSMLGNDLQLTIGLPLVSGLNIRQFAGVLAHEFGHFSQGIGMRFTFIIRSISYWFTRVVYERDEWDDRLEGWAKGLDFRICWIFHLARLFVWLTRKILWALMMLGHVVSTFMLRQMEFDADRHEARLAGSEVFESTSRKISLLSFASQGAYNDLGDFYREGRLVDDLPKLIQHNIDQFTPEVLQRINQHVNEAKTGFFDTHPCDRERYDSARKENTDGVFQLELPSTVVFSDFEDLSKAVTWDYYQGIFGENLRATQVHPIHELLERQDVEKEDFNALHRYFQGTFRGSRYLMLSKDTADFPNEKEEAFKSISDQRGAYLQHVDKYKEDSRLHAKVSPAMRDKLHSELEEFERIAAKRLKFTLQLLDSPILTSGIEDAKKLRARSGQLLEVNRKLNSHKRVIEDLSGILEKQGELFQIVSKDNSNESAINSLLLNSDEILECVNKVRHPLLSVPYPFDHAIKNISTGGFLQSDLGKGLAHDQVFHIGDDFVQSFVRFRARVIGHLCVIAEKVEKELGMEPLPEPKEEEG